MKTAWIIALALLFVSVAGFAATPDPLPVDLAQILGQPGLGGACTQQEDAVLLAAKPSQPQDAAFDQSCPTLPKRDWACCRCALAEGCAECYFCEHGVVAPLGYCS